MTADPFAIRLKFSNMLSTLGPSLQSAQKAASYAIKYKHLHEDLGSCILEQLEQGHMNIQANIMFFLEPLVFESEKASCKDYGPLIDRDIAKMVHVVCPDDGTGYQNIRAVREVLASLSKAKYISPSTCTSLLSSLDEQESVNATRMATLPRPERRLIEQRIEDDRERHKRNRELTWARDEKEEMDYLWENTSDLNEDDHRRAREEEQRRREDLARECPHGTFGVPGQVGRNGSAGGGGGASGAKNEVEDRETRDGKNERRERDGKGGGGGGGRKRDREGREKPGR